MILQNDIGSPSIFAPHVKLRVIKVGVFYKCTAFYQCYLKQPSNLKTLLIFHISTIKQKTLTQSLKYLLKKKHNFEKSARFINKSYMKNVHHSHNIRVRVMRGEMDETKFLELNNNKMKKKKTIKFPLLRYDQLPDYMKDNEYILNYYRADWSLNHAFISLFLCHNETLNVWT